MYLYLYSKGFCKGQTETYKKEIWKRTCRKSNDMTDWGRKEIEGDAGPLTSRFLNSSKGPPNSEG